MKNRMPAVWDSANTYNELQFQAAVICGCVGVIAEVSYEALKKRFDQGWLCEIIEDADTLVQRIKEAKQKKEVFEVWTEVITFH